MIVTWGGGGGVVGVECGLIFRTAAGNQVYKPDDNLSISSSILNTLGGLVTSKP